MTSEQPNVMRSNFETLHFGLSVAAGPEALIALSGELDILSVPSFEAVLVDLDFECVHHVVLDLEQLEFIDVVGLHAILALHAMCVEASVALTIMPGPRHVQRVFELTGTDRQLPFRGR